jgi:hypothetical protein
VEALSSWSLLTLSPRIPKIKLPLTKYSRIWMKMEMDRSPLRNSYFWWPLCWRFPMIISTRIRKLSDGYLTIMSPRRYFSPLTKAPP